MFSALKQATYQPNHQKKSNFLEQFLMNLCDLTKLEQIPRILKVLEHLITWLTEKETKEKECQTSLVHFNYRRMMSLTKW